MTLTEILRRRRSIRKFDGRAVSREMLEKIIGLALTAPSSKNTRSTRFMVIDKPELMEKLSEMRDFGSSFLKDAPCCVLIAGDASVDLWVDNASISATILQLAAEEAGLGSCWVHVNGRPRRRAEPDGPDAAGYLRTFLPIPAEWNLLCIIALGYSDGTPKPHGDSDGSDKIIWL